MMADVAGTSGVEASTSRSHSHSSRGYDVFLNFRGPDSRHTVVDVIHDALSKAGFRVFYDDESIRKGETIEGEIMEAIINSRIYITIFSENYASSKWCLRELAEMVKCWKDSKKRNEEKTILPIFYNVDVSTDVKLTSDLYTNALQSHNGVDEYEIKRWEDALKRAATIKGWNIRDHGLVDLTKFIKEEVCRKLWTRSTDAVNVDDKFVGLDDPTEDIMRLSAVNADDVRFVVIYGMGGMGKSTLAKLVFDKISRDFQWVGFLSGIRGKPRTENGIRDMQINLLLQLLKVDLSKCFRDSEDGVKMIKNRLHDKKVFIVLDDIDNSKQLLKLAGEPSWFGNGSRIIITTRNIGIVSDPKIEGVYRYKMPEMKLDDALKLFSRRVFQCDSPREGFNEISREVVDTIGRNPLAIDDITPSLIGQTIDAWRSIFERLKELVPKEVREVLIMSYEELEYDEKEIFLDIACLFINVEMEDAFYYWKAQKLQPQPIIMVLKSRSLIEIVDGNKLWMHGLHREIGRNLVDGKFYIREMPKSRRFWSPKVALDVVREKQAAKDMKVLKCTYCGFPTKSPDFSAFSNLERLVFKDCQPLREIDDSIGNLDKLTYLEITNTLNYQKRLHDECITFQLELPGSICKLKSLEVLKLKLVNISELPNAIGDLEKLTNLCLWCPTLRKLPESVGRLKSLVELDISHTKITKLPESVGRLKSLVELDISHTKITKLPESVTYLDNLKAFKCEECVLIGEVPNKMKRLIPPDRLNRITTESAVPALSI